MRADTGSTDCPTGAKHEEPDTKTWLMYGLSSALEFTCLYNTEFIPARVIMLFTFFYLHWHAEREKDELKYITDWMWTGVQYHVTTRFMGSFMAVKYAVTGMFAIAPTMLTRQATSHCSDNLFFTDQCKIQAQITCFWWVLVLGTFLARLVMPENMKPSLLCVAWLLPKLIWPV